MAIEPEADPTPTPTPEPPRHVLAIACPSCGSRYNPQTRELVEDTKLREKISALEAELVTLRRANEGASGELEAARARIVELEAAPAPAPAPRAKKGRDFIVGER